jgi:WD40 repeat protein
MRAIHLVIAGWLLLGLAAVSLAEETPGKDKPKDGVKVSAADIDRLILQLGDDDISKRSQAKKQLEAGGEPAVAALKTAAAASDDPEVRKAAAGLLDKIEAKARGQLDVFPDHGDLVNGVAITADGKRAVSASWDGNHRYWDLDGHTLIRQFGVDGTAINSVALSPDGKRLLSGSRDRTMRLWDLDTGTEIRGFGHPDLVWDVTFSPDGKTALSGCADSKFRLWDLESGDILQTLPANRGNAYTVAFTRDGKGAITGNGRPNNDAGGPFLRQWDLASGKEVRQFEGHTGVVRHVTISPDGKQLLSAGFDGTVRLWDLETGKELKKIDWPGKFVHSVAFTSDGKRAVCCSGLPIARAGLVKTPCSLRVWELATGKELKQFDGHVGSVFCLAVSGDGRRLVSGSGDKTMRVWEMPK